MGAMEIAHAEMNDARAQIGAAVVRRGDFARQKR